MQKPQLPWDYNLIGYLATPLATFVLTERKGPDPFVIHLMDECGNCYGGHYFSRKSEAFANLVARAKQSFPEWRSR